MKHYKSSENEVYAYLIDGSQDYLIPNNFIEISNEEADSIRKEQAQANYAAWAAAQPTKEEQIAKLQEQIDSLAAL